MNEDHETPELGAVAERLYRAWWDGPAPLEWTEIEESDRTRFVDAARSIAGQE